MPPDMKRTITIEALTPIAIQISTRISNEVNPANNMIFRFGIKIVSLNISSLEFSRESTLLTGRGL